ncbi:MAG: hypothetical protein ABIS50_25225 [Luteolibacter sp.]|uniref:hypothetical protein n=1 Tax=Luteolibacter sp. TaxID=1962973 RepID=UPI0032669EAC
MKKRRLAKLVLGGIAINCVALFGFTAWTVFEGDEVSAQEFRQLSNEANGTSMGSTSYMGRSKGYDYFRIEQAKKQSQIVRVPQADSTIKEPYPLRYWPGNWRKGTFGERSSDQSIWTFYH